MNDKGSLRHKDANKRFKKLVNLQRFKSISRVKGRRTRENKIKYICLRFMKIILNWISMNSSNATSKLKSTSKTLKTKLS